MKLNKCSIVHQNMGVCQQHAIVVYPKKIYKKYIIEAQDGLKEVFLGCFFFAKKDFTVGLWVYKKYYFLFVEIQNFISIFYF